MTIALVKVSNVSDRLVPLGLACLQAYLKERNIDVKVFNFRATEYSLPKIASDPLIQLKPPKFVMNHQDFPLLVMIVDTLLFDGDVNFDERIFPDLIEDYANRLCEDYKVTKERFESILEYIKTIIHKISNFPIVGFSIDYLNVVESVICSTLLRLANPLIKIVWGGPTITQSYEAFKLWLKRGIVDGLVVGEGELPLLDISLDVELAQIPGVMSLKNDEELFYSPGAQVALDLLPTPDYSGLPLDTYYHIASVYRSRGCTNRCQFCAEWNLFGRRFRVRSIKNVINDIRSIIKDHHPKYIIFGESLINDDLEYFENLCDAMIKEDFGVNFGTHFRANITLELAKKAKKAGFNDAWVGVEALSEKDLKDMNKRTTINQNIDTLTNFAQAGVNVLAMLVVGFNEIEEEEANCENIENTIGYFSKFKINNNEGKEQPLSIQFRPAPMFLVPGSLNYKEKRDTTTRPWSSTVVSEGNELFIQGLELELGDIPYEFDRPIPDAEVGKLMKRIQKADREAGFAIGGIAQHVISYMMEDRRNKRSRRKQERIGIIAQRFESKKNIIQ
ncbi:MAG TPA: radical SAM protein [bacterium]|nr:radical SAM protein [bacterium]